MRSENRTKQKQKEKKKREEKNEEEEKKKKKKKKRNHTTYSLFAVYTCLSLVHAHVPQFPSRFPTLWNRGIRSISNVATSFACNHCRLRCRLCSRGIGIPIRSEIVCVSNSEPSWTFYAWHLLRRSVRFSLRRSLYKIFCEFDFSIKLTVTRRVNAARINIALMPECRWEISLDEMKREN